MPDVSALLRELARSVDVRALPAVYAAVSVSADQVRGWLRQRALPFFDPAAPVPRLADVDRTADHVIVQSQGTAAALGVFGGVAGWLTAPPEVAAWIAACLRMGQRLAVVYGIDPSTDRGHAALSRAVAAGFGAELPERGLVELRVSDVVRAVARRAPQREMPQVGALVARAVVRRSARLATGNLGRLLPVVSSGLGASENHREMAEVGARMKAVLRRLAEAPVDGPGVEEAHEIVPDRTRR